MFARHGDTAHGDLRSGETLALEEFRWWRRHLSQ
jgi:hypothetical protein